ncbi:glycosyltransferase [Neochlamydia sp. S13]|uniref:glycosyltransferase n=1 Tax=Neochlamydia sp. S13 TaxID=1353976 RepID=UPI000FD17DB5|nr:glycosyltransferase [Neochlamydia sp. S13]BBI18110.1 Putative uncharacterized protein [Neochlamydia sp. S13]
MMSKIKKLGRICTTYLGVSARYLLRGFQKRCFFSYLLSYFKQHFLYLEKFTKHLEENIELEDNQSFKWNRLKETVQGLHALLPDNNRFYYSILIDATQCPRKYLKQTLRTALDITAPYKEILLAISKESDKEIKKLLNHFIPNELASLKVFNFEKNLSQSEVINALASFSQGNYLFILPVGDWMRPDLFYRYEQTLNFMGEKDFTVLFCDEYQIDHHCMPLPKTRTLKPQRPCFPYVFNDDLGHTLLIPKNLWEKIGGLLKESEGIHTFDLPLRLEAAGALFHKVPLPLYAIREENKIKQEIHYSNLPALRNILKSFENYSISKKLNWNWTPGYSKSSVRAIPQLLSIPEVHVIMLYKDHFRLTLSAVNHIMKQKNVRVKMTAIDNNSQDFSIAEKLRELGVEVIRVEEPFNYSRLNNRAVRETKIAKDIENILFLNNDVDLDADGLIEMCRWIEQPGIGLVGCRLNYPNGLLQHGGVIIESSGAAFMKSWHHEERLEKFHHLRKTNFLKISAAVTAACCMIKKKTFLEVNGFDEVWFPIAFSDTALAVKVRAKGLHCLYTPFAVGVHHESISRKKVNIEDYETLSWVHRRFVQKLWENEKIHFEDLEKTEY